jgi:dihydroorotase
VEKEVEFEQAANGVIGLETALAVAVELVDAGVLTPATLVMRMSAGPAKVLGLPGGSLAPGGAADVTVIDPQAAWICDATRFRSKARNTPFGGRAMRGRAVLTVVGGRIVFSQEKFVV